MFDKEKLKGLLKGDKRTRIIVIIGFLGIVLICASVFWPTGNKSAQENESNESSKQYEQELENKITDLISQIEGVGKAKVMVTLENGVENVYANTQKQSTNTTSGSSTGQNSQKKDSQQDVVVVDGKDGKEALVVTQKEPTVKGVVVVCEGAGNAKVEQMVTDAVTTSLNIKSNRVSVVKKVSQSNN